MAKKKRPSRAKKPAGESAEVRQAVQELRDYYKLGLKVLEKDQKNPDRHIYSKHVSDDFSKRLGVGRDYVDKARKFASSYTEKQFEQLCSLRRPDGMPLGRSLVIPLLAVKDKRKRTSLQRQAAREGWSKRQLEEEVAKVPSDRPSSGGRPPRKAQTVDSALVQIVKMSDRWNRWRKGFDAKKDEEGEGVELKELPKSVRERLARVTAEIKDLENAANRSLKRLRSQSES